MLDVEALREDFPILKREVYGRPLVYLDSAATSQKPRCVIEAIKHYYEYYNANIHRAVHCLGEEATAAYESAREKVARFINAPDASSIIFVRNTTEAINLVAHAWARHNLRPGDEVLLTEMEHHSNLVPWQMAARETGAKLRFVPVTDEGTLALDGLGAFVTERTKLVAMTQVSNALGTINPVAEVARAAHARGALMLVDGAQSVPHMPVDVQALDCDFLAFSGHKMLGPTGVGVLYVRPQVAKEMEPFLGGGEMIREVWLEEATWNEPPLRFEAGTPNIADVIGLGAAIDYLSALGMESVREHERELAAYALGVLGELDDLIIYGPLDPEQRGGVFSFNYADIHPHDLGTILDRQGVAVRAGHHCAMPLMRRLWVVATTLASFYVYTTKEEVDALAQALRKARAYFGHVAR